MKKVYVAHPYGGNEKNKTSVEMIIKKLVYFDADVLYISPIHAFGYLYNSVSYEKGMEYCLETLGSCDELILCTGWETSRGCLMEKAFAEKHNIPIKYIGDVFFKLEGESEILEENQEDNQEDNSEEKRVERLLKFYKYNREDFSVANAPVYADTMNDGEHYLIACKALVPNKIKEDLHYILINFTWDNIQFLNKNNEVLLATVGEGYDDIAKPEAFII